MGLRETKVARTRQQIVEVALDLFLDQGYGPTTMEQIAEQAEVGISTLYRYFPSKELLVLDPLARTFEFARLLIERPVDEPLDRALGAVLKAAYPGGDMDRDRFVALRGVVDREPGPRARLWDLVRHATRDLEEAIAARPDAPPQALHAALAAHNVFIVYELVGRTWSGRTRQSWERAVETVLTSLAGHGVVVPR